MTNTEVFRAVRPKPSASDASIEAAVRRLMEAGKSRKEALKMIDHTLYTVIGELGKAGIGGLSRLRQLNLSAATKLNAVLVVEANEQDAKHG